MSDGLSVPTFFYDDIKDMEDCQARIFLLVARENDLAFDKFMQVIGLHLPSFVVPPFNRLREDYTSMAAERTRAQMPKDWDVDVGVVVPSGRDTNQVEFIAWATQNDYAPIVIPPCPRRPRSWQMNQFNQHRVLTEGMWYHLSGTDNMGINLSELPGVFTWGVPIE